MNSLEDKRLTHRMSELLDNKVREQAAGKSF
jgi:hypothetical protein